MNTANRKALFNIAKRRITSNWVFTTVAISAITLTTLLFMTIFTLGLSAISQLETSTMRQTGTSAHGIIKFLSQEQYDKIKTHPLIEKIGYEQVIGDVNSDTLIKQATYLISADETCIAMNFATPSTGNYPSTEKEILMDVESLKLLGVPEEVGSSVTIEFSINGEEHTENFTLSGYYTRDPSMNVVGVYTSPLYGGKFLQSSKPYDEKTINAKIMFANKYNIEENLQTIILDSGYSIDANNPRYIDYNTNWAYVDIENSIDLFGVLLLLSATALIVFTGYLIIYNIFQISLMNNVQSYGLLRVMGTTRKQIKRINTWQIFILTIVAIPIGLFLGYLISNILMPFLMKISNLYYNGMELHPTIHPTVLIGSSVLSFVTVWVSVTKPNRLISKISPIKALRPKNRHVIRMSRKPIGKLTIFNMARISVIQNKKQTALTIISLALSLILLNSLFTVTNGFDMEKYVSQYVNKDFLIAHARYFQFIYNPAEHALNDDIISRVESTEGFLEGFKICSGSKSSNEFDYRYFVDTDANLGGFRNDKNHVNVDLYGADTAILDGFSLLDGELNIQKLNSGNYLLEPVIVNNNGEFNAQYKIGDTVQLYYQTEDGMYIYREAKIMAHVEVNWYTETRRSFGGQMFYTTSKGVQRFYKSPAIMSYSFNVDSNHLTSMEHWLADYTTQQEYNLSYEAKSIFEDNFQTLKSTFIVIGSVLSYVIGIIGLINFINSTITNISARKLELAMLESIGMSKKQRTWLLSIEGLYYAITVAITSLAVSAILSLTAIRILSTQIWFMSYQFTIVPAVICTLLLSLLGVALPAVSFTLVDRKSVVEKLQEVV